MSEKQAGEVVRGASKSHACLGQGRTRERGRGIRSPCCWRVQPSRPARRTDSLSPSCGIDLGPGGKDPHSASSTTFKKVYTVGQRKSGAGEEQQTAKTGISAPPASGWAKESEFAFTRALIARGQHKALAPSVSRILRKTAGQALRGGEADSGAMAGKKSPSL